MKFEGPLRFFTVFLISETTMTGAGLDSSLSSEETERSTEFFYFILRMFYLFAIFSKRALLSFSPFTSASAAARMAPLITALSVLDNARPGWCLKSGFVIFSESS